METVMFHCLRNIRQLCLVASLLSFFPLSVFLSSVSYTYDTHHRLIKAAYDNGAAIDSAYDSDNDGIPEWVEVSRGTDPADADSGPSDIVYEDGENGKIAGWNVYDNDPDGATISNAYDEDRPGNVIEFADTGSSNGYRLRNPDGTYWNDMSFNVLEWSMKYNETFTVYIPVRTKDGFHYLYYTPTASDNLGSDTYIHHGLGSHVLDDTWQTFVRDLAYDLKDAQPDNELQAVLGFLIRGIGRVDDIRTHRADSVDYVNHTTYQNCS